MRWGRRRRSGRGCGGARRRRFVGRAGELELLRAAVEEPAAPWGVLFVYGPGGVGKTALLAAFAEAAEAVGRARVAGRSARCRAVASGLPGGRRPARWGWPMARRPWRCWGRAGDGCCCSTPMSRPRAWTVGCARTFCPVLGAESRVVVAGRDAPSRGWLEDAGWRDLLRVVALRNLSPDEARAFLRVGGRRRGRARARCSSSRMGIRWRCRCWSTCSTSAAMRRLCWGSSSARRRTCCGVLLERFVAGVPSERHRRALEVCAHARVTSEDLLRTALGGEDRWGAVRVVARAVVRGVGRRRAVPARPCAGRPGCGSALARSDALRGRPSPGAAARGGADPGGRGP